MFECEPEDVLSLSPGLGALLNFIIKFGYNARCHWLKERALLEYRA